MKKIKCDNNQDNPTKDYEKLLYEVTKLQEYLLKLSNCKTYKAANYIHNMPLPINNKFNVLQDIAIKLSKYTYGNTYDELSKYDYLMDNDDFSDQYKLNISRIRNIKIIGKKNKKFIRLLEKYSNHKIIIYPAVIDWKPFQTPQQLLLNFAKLGYLCIFCTHNYKDERIKKLDKNIYSVPEDVVISSLGNRHVNVLLTWMASVPFTLAIENKTVWYHILDKLEIFHLYGSTYEKMHDAITKDADIVSYVSKPLLEYINKRKKDSIYLPNAVNPDDIYKELNKRRIPKDLKTIVNENKPILGYFGWIEYWFDFNMLYKIAKNHQECNFVLIGPVNLNKKEVKNGYDKLSSLKNIYFLGKKNYYDLPKYAKYFSVGIIPFLINEMTNCVSPIKFYEYCAYGIPTISSYMGEMVDYTCEYIECYKTYKEFNRLICEFLKKEVLIKAKKNAKNIADKNSWMNRVIEIDKNL